MQDVKFPPLNRVLKRREYELILKKGCRFHSGSCLLCILKKDDGVPRLGLIVSRKVGNAVVRNRVKRVVREIFRRNKFNFSSVDIVFIARRNIIACGYRDIEEAFLSSIKKVFGNGKGRC